MTIHVNYLEDHILLMQLRGHVTKDQVKSIYQRFLDEKLAYVIVDELNMMLDSYESLYDASLKALVKQIVTQDAFKQVIIVLPEDSEHRDIIKTNFREHGVPDKLSFALTVEDAKQRITAAGQQGG